MLSKISIKNIALMHEATVDLTTGLNVLTGETGAGKSLIIDSLALLLGEKADKGIITHGQNFAIVEAVFENISDKVKQEMEELGLEKEDVVIISRKITVDGKNECRVNGRIFTLSMIKKITAYLMDMHGQFEHQNLLKVSNHLQILDSYGIKDIGPNLEIYKKLYYRYNEIENELNSLCVDEKERQRMIELYSYQINEIEEAGFYDGEEEELKSFRQQVLNQEKIIGVLENSILLLEGNGYEDGGSIERVKKTESLLNSISSYYSLDDIIARLSSLTIELKDISETIEEKKDNVFIDDRKAKQNEERLDLLSSFKKKYGNDIPAINCYLNEIKSEYDKLINSVEKITKLQNEKTQIERELIEKANILSQKRKNIALKFKSDIEKELKDLSMKNAVFEIKFEPLNLENRTIQGLDKIEFMFSANLGEPVKPLKNVASGGEMSRFMLATKNITAKIEEIPTLIFDEIDTGVSGIVAIALAKKLASVSKQVQVICVTHLPQIASFAVNHLLIVKEEDNNKTTTLVKPLYGEQRELEIARLISGKISNHSISHAKEMIEESNNFYKN